MTITRASQRTVSLGVCLVGAVGLVVLAGLVVPWDPVPGGVPEPVAARSLFTEAEIERAEAYSTAARMWSWSSLALTLLLLGLVGFTGLGARVVDRLPGSRWVRVVLGVTGLLLALRVLTLPFAVGSWRLRVENGLSTQTWGSWSADLVRSELVEVVTTTAVVLVLVGTARRWRTWWPAVTGALLGSLVVLASFVYPLVVEPVFNSFEPLPPGALRAEITRVAHEQGVSVEDVVVADASRRTTTLNAWVSGLGGTRRVVLYDNLVEEVPQEQVMAVVAHELAHARHQDVVAGTAMGAAGVVAAVGLLGLVWPRISRTPLGEPQAAVLVVTLLAFGTQLSAPLQNGVSRQVELRADVSALGSTDDPEGFVQLQRQLAVRSLADPTPPAVAQWWWGSHPGVLTRVAVARGSGGALPAATHPRGQAVAGAVEEVGHGSAEEEHGGHHHCRDAGDEQPVLDGGGSALVAGSQVQQGREICQHRSPRL